jgi:hypothetical protein
MKRHRTTRQLAAEAQGLEILRRNAVECEPRIRLEAEALVIIRFTNLDGIS